MASARDKLIVALDVPTESEALSIVEELRGHVSMFKVGNTLVSATGYGLVERLSALQARCFLDIKIHDIPHSAAGMASQAAKVGPEMMNMHSSGGSEMMRAVVAAAKDEAQKAGLEPPQILAVTVLTSISQQELNDDLRVPGEVADQVVHLAKLAQRCGANGVIASPLEIDLIRSSLPAHFRVVTPGVRPAWASPGDQKRVATPCEAVRRGADYVVVGRPVLNPPAAVGGRLNAVEKILEELESA